MVSGIRGQLESLRARILQDSTRQKAVYRAVRHPLAIPAVIFVTYFMLNLGIGGPAYMSDEVGYLSKAATIAGDKVQLTTSWFGGYSFLISPAFLFVSDPYVSWHIILVLNALMWAGSAALLRYVLRAVYPQASELAIGSVTIGAMLYPSWLSMSGYAFSTNSFVLIFMAALAALVKSQLSSYRWLGAAAICGGLLCWMHPLGFLFVGLLSVVLLLLAIVRKDRIMPLLALGGAGLGLSYVLVVHPWLNRLTSGSITDDTHYTEGYGNILQSMTTLDYWLQVGLLLTGFTLFLVVATFGLAAYGMRAALQSLVSGRQSWRLLIVDARLVVQLLPVAAVLAVIVFTSLSWGITGQLRIDQWVYGRYTDLYLLPLIAFGMMSTWRMKHAVLTAGLVVVAGIALSAFTNPENTSFIFNNKVNIQGLWPMHLASIVHANYYWLWGLIGAAGIIMIGFMGTHHRKPLLAVLIIPVMLTGAGNYLYNRTVTKQHASVSSLYTHVLQNYSPDECIGFTPSVDNHERFNLYAYYLHGYDLRKMTVAQWKAEGCTGPYLTYDQNLTITDTDLHVAGVEKQTGLLMMMHTPELAVTAPAERLIFN